MPTYRVFMTAFGKPGEIRMVDINERPQPTTDTILNDVYYHGQNDVQPKQHPSVSMGDIIEIPVDDTIKLYYLVKSTGFHQMTTTDIIEFMHTDRVNRSFHPLVRGR